MKFSYIYSRTIREWERQVEQFTSRIFNGSDSSISALGKLFQDGMMITGMAD
jgi:hypothetical protein